MLWYNLILFSDLFEYLIKVLIDRDLPYRSGLVFTERYKAVPDLAPFQIQNLFPVHARIDGTNDDPSQMLWTFQKKPFKLILCKELESFIYFPVLEGFSLIKWTLLYHLPFGSFPQYMP